MEKPWLRSEYKVSRTLLDNPPEEPEDYHTEILGNIFGFDDSDETICIGKVRWIRIEVDEAQDNGMSLFDVFDGDQKTIEFYELYDEENGRFKETVLALVGADGISNNILIGDRLEISPEYRGMDCTRRIQDDAIGLFAQSDIVAIKAFPLQFEVGFKEGMISDWQQSINLGDFETEEKKATENLMQYYESCGFVRVPDTQLMVRKTW